MDISGVRVKLIHDSGDRLKAVCTVTFDECFVVRDVKVVDGTNGLFVAMPSRKMSSHCPACRQKNHLKASFCNNCGKKLPPPRPQSDSDGRSRLHKDLAHPITPEFREVVQAGVLAEFQTELERAGETLEREAPREPRSRRPTKPPRETRETKPKKPEDDMEDIQPLALSEYDAIIADLKGGSSPPARRERPQPHDSQDAPEPAAEVETKPERADEPVHNDDPKPVIHTDDNDSWPVFEEEEEKTPSSPPVEDETPAKVTEPETAGTVVNYDDSDESSGFGEGIL